MIMVYLDGVLLTENWTYSLEGENIQLHVFAEDKSILSIHYFDEYGRIRERSDYQLEWPIDIDHVFKTLEHGRFYHWVARDM